MSLRFDSSLIARMMYITLIIIFLSTLFSFRNSEGKIRHKKGRKLEYKCSSEFLWEALLAAGKGNDSAAVFLGSSLSSIGFGKNGVEPRSLAAYWQSKLGTLKSRSVFSQLQSLGTLELNTACPSCAESTEDGSPSTQPSITNPVATGNKFKTQKRLRKDQKVSLKYLVKSINSLYVNATAETSPIAAKSRKKKLRRLLKRFMLQQPICSGERDGIVSETKSKSKRRRKNSTQLKTDVAQTCLSMIEELIDQGMCEDVGDAFHWTLREVERNYGKDSGVIKSIMAPVPANKF